MTDTFNDKAACIFDAITEREAREEAKIHAEALFEEIKDRAYEFCVDLDWYTDEVIKYIEKEREDAE